MKRKLIMLMAVAISAGTTVTGLAASLNFSDINNVPWEGAKKYISDVADAGLMVGDKNSSGQTVFRAKDKVTYCETVQLAYSILKLTGNLKSTSGLTAKWANVMKGYNIPSWSYEPVAYALENSIVSVYDVSRFMKAASVNNYATREDVSVIFGKALSSIYNVNSSASVSFSDNSKIAATSVPYIELLSRLGIMVGDNENKFNPRNYINRAEMAVVVSNTNSKLSNSTDTGTNTNTNTSKKTVTGTILNVENLGVNQMITVMDDITKVGFIGNNAVPVTYQGKAVKFSDLTVGDNVTITYEGATIISVLLNFDFIDSSVTSKVSGTINRITNEKLTLDKNSGGSSVYTLSSSLTLKLDGSSATMKDYFDAIDDGDEIDAEITVNTLDQVTEIVGTSSARNVNGKIKSISRDEIKIYRNSSTYTYDFDDDIKIKLEGKSSSYSKVDDALDDDTLYAKLTLNGDDDVTLLEASEDEDVLLDDYDGELVDIDDDELTMKKIGTSRRYDYDIDEDATIRLNGSSSTIKKIQNELDDEKVYINLSFNSDDEVTKIVAETRDSDEIKGTLTDITSSRMTIKPSGESSEKYKYVDEDDLSIKIDGRSRNLSALEDQETFPHWKMLLTMKPLRLQ